ncbi:MAG TPA: sugar ABC transporter substrate-binding protein [bacterium]|nr:sugar ABC transporter substrate-binding protein [bacterium]
MTREDRSRFSRRQALRLGGAAAVTAVLATRGALPARGAPQITVKWISVERGEPRNSGMRKTVEVFGRNNPNVKVDLELVPFDQYFQKVAIALSSGSGIDVFDVDSPLVTSYAVQDALLPLDEYIDKNDWLDFVGVERRTATVQGKIMSVPWSSSEQGLYYNVEMLDAAGIKPARSVGDRWTWEQTLEAARKLTRTAPDGSTSVWGLTIEQVDRPYQILPLLESNGALPMAQDGKTVSGYINSPQAVEAVRFYGDLFNRWKVSPKKQLQDAFGNKQAALYLANTPWVNILRTRFPDLRFGVMPHPYFKKPVTPTGAWHLGVFKKTAHPKEAAELAKTFGSREVAETAFKTMNYMPVRNSTFERFAADFQAAPWNLFLFEMKNTAVRRPATPAYREYEDLLRTALRNVMEGGEPKAELDAAAGKIDREIAKYVRK